MSAAVGGEKRMGKARRQKRSREAGDEVGPTPERRQKGDVARMERSIADEAGRPSRPFRATDTLAAMLRRRSITPAMHQAGEDFRAVFRVAHLDPLRAASLERVPDGLRELPLT